VTEVAPVKLFPVMITESPELLQALIGLKLDMDWAELSIQNRKAIRKKQKRSFRIY